MPRTGIEPVTRGFSVLCSTNWAIEAKSNFSEIRLWVSPFGRNITHCFLCIKAFTPPQRFKFASQTCNWMEKDSNLRRRCQQIYSLPPLATRESTHNGTNRARTYDPLLVRQVLSQLSYDSFYTIASAWSLAKRPGWDSNPRPPPWQGGALTNWATGPN